MNSIYLDYNATTPVDPVVLSAMLPYLREDFGNPSSGHALGQRARDAVEGAREEVAALIGASSDEIVFTSGGTEASNMAIRGAAKMQPDRCAVVTSNIEHPATDACCALLEREGHPLRRVAAGRNGIVELAGVQVALLDDTALVSVIHAQNEIGTLQPIAAIAKIARAAGALVHTDAAQSIGKVPVDVNALNVDLLSIAGHKLYAPKGIGALYLRRGVKLPPLMVGAGQELGRRPGTENVPYIVALGEACRLAAIALEETSERIAALADCFRAKLAQAIPDIIVVGDPADRLPNTLNVLFPEVSGRQLLANCPRVIASNGSACHAEREEPSAILLAIGIPREAALGAVRLSLGRMTTLDDVEAAAASLATTWRALRQQAPARAAS